MSSIGFVFARLNVVKSETVSINRLALLLIALTTLAAISTAVMAFLALEAAVDDAYIVYRYVERFVASKGLTFNDGERVEGFTSLLWTVLLTFPARVGLRPHLTSVAFNYLLILSSAASVGWLLRILGTSRAFIVVGLFLFSASITFFKVVYLGLELGLFAFLLILFLCSLLIGLDYPRFSTAARNAAFVSGAISALLFATRPESIVILPLSITVFLIGTRKWYVAANFSRSSIGPFSVIVLCIVLWRRLYYDAWLPNSVIAKSVRLSSIEWREWLEGSASYFYHAYSSNLAVFLAILLAIILVVQRRRAVETSLLLLPLGWQHIVVVENGGDWMPYHRFVILYAPLLVVFIVRLSEDLWTCSRTRGVFLLVVFTSLYVHGNVQHLRLNGSQLDRAIGRMADERWYEGELYDSIGRALNEVWVPGDILASEAIGRIGYTGSQLFIHDPSGLTDNTLSHDGAAIRSVYGRTNWRYSVSLRPAVIVLHWWPRELTEEILTEFSSYCAGPIQGAMLYVLIRQDKVSTYLPALKSLELQALPEKERDLPEAAASVWCQSRY
jgi:arabinofuranosyltransferase